VTPIESERRGRNRVADSGRTARRGSPSRLMLSKEINALDPI